MSVLNSGLQMIKLYYQKINYFNRHAVTGFLILDCPKKTQKNYQKVAFFFQMSFSPRIRVKTRIGFWFLKAR